MAKLINIPRGQTTRARTDDTGALGEYHKVIVPIYFVVAAIALGLLAFSIRGAGPLPIDLEATHVVQSINAGWYDLLMRATGEPGYPPQVYALVVWIIAVLFLTGLKWEALIEVFATVGIGVVGLAVKMFAERPRPDPNMVRVLTVLDKGQLSFPAGHVESYVAIIGFLWFLSFVACKNPWVRSISLFVFGEMMALIGISRIYTGEHWMTDAVGGYLLGSLWLILTIWVYEWGKSRFFVKKEKTRT